MIHYNEHKIKVIRNYLGLIIQKQIIKTSKSNKGLSKELIVLMYLLIVVLDTPSHVAALPIE